MLIFFERRLVFLATPKAGSTAVEVALDSLASVAVERPAVLKHIDIAGFERHIRPWLTAASGGAHFTTVALMREPVEWLRSWYRFRLRDDVEDPDHAMEGLSFENFARAWLDPAAPDVAHVGSQSAFLTGPAGERVDRIFRYEEIETFTHFLEDRLDCAISLPRVNVPPSVDVALTAVTEARLRRALAADVELYASLGDEESAERAATG